MFPFISLVSLSIARGEVVKTFPGFNQIWGLFTLADLAEFAEKLFGAPFGLQSTLQILIRE